MTPPKRSDAPSRRHILAGAIAAISFAAPPAGADDVHEPMPGVSVKHPVILQPGAGAPRVTLRIENDSGGDIWLTGLRGPQGAPGEITIRPLGGAPSTVAQVLVADGETLDLASSHLELEFPRLRRLVAPDEPVSLVLEFRGFDLALEARGQ